MRVKLRFLALKARCGTAQGERASEASSGTLGFKAGLRLALKGRSRFSAWLIPFSFLAQGSGRSATFILGCAASRFQRFMCTNEQAAALRRILGRFTSADESAHKLAIHLCAKRFDIDALIEQER
jgi:hypothetical protein